MSADQLQTALRTLIDRKARTAYPEGLYDWAGRWRPTTEETRACCFSIRPPSWNYPNSLLEHCRTLKHVAMLYDVPYRDLYNAWKTYVKGLIKGKAKENL